MKVVICYKLVPDVSNVKVKADRTLDLSECEWSISQYDLNATEAANRLVASNEGSTLTALTFGGDITDNSKLRKAILARGPHDLVIVKDEAAGSADTYATARSLPKRSKDWRCRCRCIRRRLRRHVCPADRQHGRRNARLEHR